MARRQINKDVSPYSDDNFITLKPIAGRLDERHGRAINRII